MHEFSENFMHHHFPPIITNIYIERDNTPPHPLTLGILTPTPPLHFPPHTSIPYHMAESQGIPIPSPLPHPHHIPMASTYRSVNGSETAHALPTTHHTIHASYGKCDATNSESEKYRPPS